MILLSISALTTSLLILALLLVSFSISKKQLFDREKNSPFECGFDPNKSARIPFSLRFFLLAVIFLIFDIEIVLLLPTPLIIYSLSIIVILPLSLFLLILLIGLIYEWSEGALEWAK